MWRRWTLAFFMHTAFEEQVWQSPKQSTNGKGRSSQTPTSSKPSSSAKAKAQPKKGGAKGGPSPQPSLPPSLPPRPLQNQERFPLTMMMLRRRIRTRSTTGVRKRIMSKRRSRSTLTQLPTTPLRLHTILMYVQYMTWMML